MKPLRKLKLKEIIVNNFWLKLISFIIAVIAWFYFIGEITKGGSNI